MRWVVALAALASLSCARNAFLELEIELPKNEWKAAIGDRFAVLRVATIDTPFEQEWQGDNPIPAVKVLETGPTTIRVSVEADSDSETKPVRLKARFCRNATCTEFQDDVGAPEVWLELERAFYIGQRTKYQWKIACIPNVPSHTPATPACDVPHKAKTAIGRCLVGGCRSGQTTNYCAGGKHFCEE